MNNIEIQIGRGDFRQQIIDDVPEATIRAGWEPELSEYKKMRLKYLLYPWDIVCYLLTNRRKVGFLAAYYVP